MPLDAIAAELYGLTPDQFTAARGQQVAEARAHGDKTLAAEIQRLRKPSTAAWLVNMLVRHRADDVAAILRLGESLHRAQEQLDAPTMRELTTQRQAQLRSVGRQASELAEQLGSRASAAVLDDVTQTLQTATVDATAAAAVRTGLLITALSSPLQPTDLAGAVAIPGAVDLSGLRQPQDNDAPVRAGRKTDRDRAAHRAPNRAADRRKRMEAQQRADAATERAAEAQQQLDEAVRLLSELGSRREQLGQELSDIRDAIADLDRRQGSAERDRAAAERRAGDAKRREEQARKALDRLG